MEVDQQTLADGQQIGPRFAQLAEHLGAGQHPQEGVLAEVGGIPAVAQALVQPVLKPAAMLPIEAMQGLLGGARRFAHVNAPGLIRLK
ncbi:hypothetical protein D3C75_1175350 [compost metagenome]